MEREKVKQTRGPRYERSRKDRHIGWAYTRNDAVIVKYLARYRYLRGASLHAILKEITGAPPVTVNYSLKKLVKAGILNKPRVQRKAYNTVNDTDIYELDQKHGYALLHQQEPEATNLTRQGATGYDVQFRHSMMICDAMSSIELGVLQTEGYDFITQAEILAKVTHKNALRLPCTIRHKFDDGHVEEIRDTFAIPDGVFGIRHPDGRTFLYLLEANHFTTLSRNELKQSSTLKKLLCYKDIKTKKTITQLGKKNFTVLFVFPRFRQKRESTGQLSRIENAKELIEKLYGQSDLFMLKYMAVQEEEWKYPKPYPELFTGPWLRGGMEDGYLVE